MGLFKPNIKWMLLRQNDKGLIKALKHKDSEVRKNATQALAIIVHYGVIKRKTTVSVVNIVESLIGALRDEKLDVRVEAAKALGKAMDAKAFEPLINIVTDKSESTDIRKTAAKSLVDIVRDIGPKGKAAVPFLAEMLGTAEYEYMRRSIASALSSVGPDAKSAVPALTIALGDSSPDVRKASARALDEIGVDDETTRDAIVEVLRASLEYFNDDVSSGNGLCSDNSCPCPDVVIPRGTGYLYIEQELVDFRRKYRSIISAREAMQRKHADIRADFSAFTGFYRIGPILVCEQGARRRNLDLEVAAADAKYWWENGKVPLRVTPLKQK